MSRRWWFGLVWVVVLALFAGCEKDKGPREGAGGDAGQAGGSGGQGGGGGEAGSGGSGGSGGTGGTGPACGNGVVEGDEECDDGNRENADACSAECRIQGTCDLPIDFWSVAHVTFEPEMFGVERVSFSGHAGNGAGTCGGGGDQLVFRVDPPGDGVLLVDFLHDAPRGTSPVVLVREVCADPASQLGDVACIPNTAALRVFQVTAGEPLFLLVDSGGATGFKFTLDAGFFRYRQEGESCSDLFASRQPCEAGLSCDDVASRGVCVPNVAPILHEAQLFRAGPEGRDILVQFSGEDSNGNAAAVWAEFYDDDGEPVVLRNPNPAHPNRRSLGGFQRGSIGVGGWMRIVNFFSDDPALSRAVSADVLITDSGRAESATIRVPIGTQPVAQQGEPCDRDRFRNVCEVGTACVEEGGVCEELAPLRTDACAAAPSLELGVPLPFVQAVPVVQPPFPPHLWEIPLDCFSDLALKRSDFFRIDLLVTQIARLSLDRERTNVEIRLDDAHARDLVMMLYPDCGTSEPPLACADDVEDPKSRVPELTFPSLPAGEYLVAVRPVSPISPTSSWTLEVTADP